MKNSITTKNFISISLAEISEFLERKGFQKVSVPNCDEIVFGKLLGKNVCIRVYTSVVGSSSRDCGKDALRVAVFGRNHDKVVLRSGSKRVNRIGTWKKNLQARIDELSEKKYNVVKCPCCGSLMTCRKSKKGGNLFWGCSSYPKCNKILSIS